MRSINIGIFLLLIAVLCFVKNVNSKQNDSSFTSTLRTKRETVSGNKTPFDSVNDEIDDINVIYVCGGGNSANSTNLNPPTSTTILPVTVFEAATFALNKHLILIVLIAIFFIAIAHFFGGIYYYQNLRIIQIPRNCEDDKNLLEEDFDTGNV